MSTRRRIAGLVAVAGSCFALLLVLAAPFGGPGGRDEAYRLRVAFAAGGRVVPESAVRISGVRVGRVAAIATDRRSGRRDVVLELDPRFAPVPSDARATLRGATLLGETHVELSPGTPGAPRVPPGGRLPAGRSSSTVGLGEALRTLDAPTRRALQDGIRSAATVLGGRGADLSAAVGTLSPFARDGGALLRILDDQDAAVRRLVRDGGAAAGALSARRGELRELVDDAGRLLSVTGRRSASLRATAAGLGPFARQARDTTERISALGRRTDPLLARLSLVAQELPATLRDLGRLAPELRALLGDLEPVVEASRTGLPAVRRTTDALRPALRELEPLLAETNPAVAFVGRYPGQIRSFLFNAAAATQASAPDADGTRRPYLRVLTPLNLESLSGQRRRAPGSRPNAYPQPGLVPSPDTGPPVLEARGCARPVPDVAPLRELQELLGAPSGLAAPPCVPQAPFRNADGSRSDVPIVPAER